MCYKKLIIFINYLIKKFKFFYNKNFINIKNDL